MKRIIFFILLLAIFGCNKYESVDKKYPDLIGNWTHLSANDGFHHIYIDSNGKGSMYGLNEHDNNQDTQRRKWFVKENVLYFSRWQNNASEDLFAIEKYPSEADTIIHLDFDSIPEGNIYMVLNNRTYRKMK